MNPRFTAKTIFFCKNNIEALGIILEWGSLLRILILYFSSFFLIELWVLFFRGFGIVGFDYFVEIDDKF